ncbi:hypothetical protein EYF80_035191 [Liparis tanakae]|uniref:Uncharacterized protein n=1 Tax=Liparis tanakae TaxID=230148 RepID=A0A4Z2GMT3_9TELE|nr:hypothetical protein EYF80_035191 [Liparis tanakae]
MHKLLCYCRQKEAENSSSRTLMELLWVFLMLEVVLMSTAARDGCGVGARSRDHTDDEFFSGNKAAFSEARPSQRADTGPESKHRPADRKEMRLD